MENKFIYNKKLVYTIESDKCNNIDLLKILKKHPEIKFASFVAVDLMGKDTDEKIPIDYFIKNMDELLGGGIQTDGSSVDLGDIATLDDARVDLIPDNSVDWYVDYNYENVDPKTQLPTGTLRIWSFLSHNGRFVDSRHILQESVTRLKKYLVQEINSNPEMLKHYEIPQIDSYEDINFMLGTELEFWVRTPYDHVNIPKLVLSQSLKEQYWKRTQGVVRTALEQALEILSLYKIKPEMGHKEVGGVKTYVAEGSTSNIVEQLEIDWKYSDVVTTLDNELMARTIIEEVFRLNGLEVSFDAKPIKKVAGNGKHCHLSIMLTKDDGKKVNLLEPIEENTFMSKIGWGMIMGILQNYEYINPFISNTTDALKRLTPGYEAPTHTVASIGRSATEESRNRTVLAGLVRDRKNPLATRFELRSPNPKTNIYMAIAAIYASIQDGLDYTLQKGLTNKQIEKEFCKEYEEEGEYFSKNRIYREEDDIFEKYTEEERNKLFGNCPRTVYENVSKLKEKNVIEKALGKDIVKAFMELSLENWILDLDQRIIPKNRKRIIACKKLEDDNDYDEELWSKILVLKKELAKDDRYKVSLISSIDECFNKRDYEEVSKLQLEMNDKMNELETLYEKYKNNRI